MKPIIEVENLSKLYRIGSTQRYLSLRDSVSSFGKKLLGHNVQIEQEKRTFWALQDINFKIEAGESVGIIGRNGAGKSTLLKILSRITPPTKGQAILRGRLASLLEVGTGFHTELTGRENVYMNGSILGLQRSEINRKFDEIVSFSGVERFIDTPLKHYSSGMQLRLAFSVAAHLEPDILIIDEVLAVGDSFFQQKCIEKMLKVRNEENRTLIFVSHNLATLKQLCNRCFLLEEGKIVSQGITDDVISIYNNRNLLKGLDIDLSSIPRKGYQQGLLFKKIHFNKDAYKFGENIYMELTIERTIASQFHNLDFGINITDQFGVCIIHLANKFLKKQLDFDIDTQIEIFKCYTTTSNLKPGNYTVTLFLRANDEIQDFLIDILTITIIEDNVPDNFHLLNHLQGRVITEFDFHK